MACPMLCLCWVLPVLGLVMFVAWKWTSSNKNETKLHVPKWKKDVVYLVQVNVAKEVRTISPFALKLETWLRLAKIPYENVYSLKPGSKGQTPYIEFNGVEIPDTNLIMRFLNEKFPAKNPDASFGEGPLARAHAVRVMMENHTAFYGFYWRYTRHYTEIMGLVDLTSLPRWMKLLGKITMSCMIRLRFHLHGISRHSYEEMDRFSFDDLESISVQLGPKQPYFLGDQPSSIDCTLFGHLAQFLYIPLDFPQKKFMRENCPNLVDYVERMKSEFWPDWEEMCQDQCMEGKKGLGI